MPTTLTADATEIMGVPLTADLTEVDVNSLVVVDGVIAADIVIGDDYLAANNRQFQFDFDVPVDVDIADALCFFGGSRPHCGSWLVAGTLSEVTVSGIAKWRASFDLPRSETLHLSPGCFDWSAKIQDAMLSHITTIRGTVEVVASQTG